MEAATTAPKLHIRLGVLDLDSPHTTLEEQVARMSAGADAMQLLFALKGAHGQGLAQALSLLAHAC